MRSHGTLISISESHQLCKGGGRRGGGGGGGANADAIFALQKKLLNASAKVGQTTGRQQSAAKGQVTRIENQIKRLRGE